MAAFKNLNISPIRRITGLIDERSALKQTTITLTKIEDIAKQLVDEVIRKDGFAARSGLIKIDSARSRSCRHRTSFVISVWMMLKNMNTEKQKSDILQLT